ncbi:glycosyltransferase [Algibacter sp.]|nr:glycosyltransferase [Algibacter sp.]
MLNINKMSNMQIPFFSFVIANYNYGDMLGASIESILNQSNKDFEIIVVDGASTDNSVEVIKKYEKKLSWWVSEKDTGQSNAFNKGFAQANGKFITWLNADDILLPGTVEAVKSKLLNNTDADWATGNFLRFSVPNLKITEAAWGPHYLPNFLQGSKRVNAIFGPTTFWRKSVYDKIGGIDENLHYMMDVEYWARLSMLGYKQVRVNHYCWGFRMHENSKTAEFSEHEVSNETKTKMDAERKYIYDKTGFKYSSFFRYLALFFRIIDGSHIKAMWNKIFLVGSNIEDKFDINLKIEADKS